MSNNERNFRCIPQNLSMSESSPVCQPWSYASGHPMSAMLDSRYFLSANDRLRPGDTIRIVQMKSNNIHARDNEVLAFADAMVQQTGKVNIAMHIEKRITFGEKQEAVTEENIENSGSGVDSEAISTINETIETMRQSISTILEEGKSLTSEDLDSIGQSLLSGEAFKDLTTNVSNLSQAVLEIQESMDGAPVTTTAVDPDEEVHELYHKWNPGKGEHQAVTGEGEDMKVLFSHKNKKEVEKFLSKQ